MMWLLFLALTSWAESPTCKAMKTALVSRPTLEIRMVFGYKDARPARFVGDRHERLAFIEHITAPCEGDQMACGFERSPRDADLFTKPVSFGDHMLTARIIVVNSSVGTDDEENRSDPFQKWKSAHARLVFLDGLKNADVVLYDGHSRFGGGPDFRSPVLASNGNVDPDAYRTEKAGLKRMLEAFEEASAARAGRFGRLKLLGLYSCTSSQLFNREIRHVFQGGLIASQQLMYYSDALSQSLTALDDVLSGRCPRNVGFD